jgi:hypothetical protein
MWRLATRLGTAALVSTLMQGFGDPNVSHVTFHKFVFPFQLDREKTTEIEKQFKEEAKSEQRKQKKNSFSSTKGRNRDATKKKVLEKNKQ